jgi:rSAM/selenodomain-associated transferase 2/rSAM/selenodomain-associated transferase 1
LVSIVIPVLNDTESLARLLPTVPSSSDVEVIVVNGGAPDSRLATLIDQVHHVSLLSSPPGRGRQMNVGARAARGRWLLFVHADTHLPSEWLGELQRADRGRSIVAGSFRFALDADAWQARFIERAVRWRVRWLDLAYGDQALFVRRDTFQAIGGFREWPLMEDVDLIRRLRQVGRLYHSRKSAVTSARRWQKDGWWRRSGENILLQLLYFAGVAPARLARWYTRHVSACPDREALVIMARAPSDARGKSRLTCGLAGDHVDLRSALFKDTLESVAPLRHADLLVAFEPPDALAEFQSLTGGATSLFPQRGETLGHRMRNVFADVFGQGYSTVVIIGSDLPTLPVAYVEQAFECLHNPKNDVVIGPARDGGYYLIGLHALWPELFESVPWSTSEVLTVTLRAADQLRLSVSLAPEWYDVDGVEDLRRVAGATAAAQRTRAWLASHPDIDGQSNATFTGDTH